MFTKNLCLALVIGTFAVSVDAHAKPGKGHPNKGKPTRINGAFVVNPALTDLVGSKGSIDYMAKKPRSLKAVVRLPIPAASVGISDEATAAAQEVHMELSRDGVAYADCSFAFQASHDSDDATPPTVAQYRLHVKTNGKHDVKGTCGNGTVPTIQSGDTIRVYTLVNGAPVDFMSK
jgi:hypothetical protein